MSDMTDTLPRSPKGLMFDLDGTLILSDRKLGGYTAISGAAETLRALDERGIPWIAMTNGSAYPASVQAPKLRAVGLPVRDERLFTPNSVAARTMLKRGYGRVLVLGTQGVADALTEAGVRCVLPDDPSAHDTDAVYIAWHPHCTMPDIHLACERVLDGAAFLTASDVPFFATREGRSFGYSCAINGAVARVTGHEPEPCGKPSALALRLIAEQLGLPEAEVGVVGDDAVAEMQMARAGGAIGIAVASGSTSREQWGSQPAERAPHVVIDSVADLLTAGLIG
jgi:HAD superfamily hydrolase (TIGR01450 family)